jgi:endo-1,4-beta-xylanase
MSFSDAKALSLDAHAKQKGLFYGAAVELQSLHDPDFAATLVHEAGLLVPSWETKRNLIEPAQGEFDFSKANEIFGFAKKHKLNARGHALVWYRANPSWLSEALSDSGDEALLTDYITTVVGKFCGQLHSWDVINEPIEPSDGQPGGLRNNIWLKAFGPRYIDLAFETARAADPDALLVLNEYNIDYNTPSHEARRRALLRLLTDLVKRGVPIDALGLQGHLGAFDVSFNAEQFANFLTEVTDLGLKLIVTELDVVDRGGPSTIAARDDAVAEMASRYLDVVLAQPNALGVITWGLSDKYTWLTDESYSRWPDGEAPRVLPFDTQFHRKKLWHAIARAFDGATVRRS